MLFLALYKRYSQTMGFRYLPSSKTALRFLGFTLIEILVVISLLALLTPNLQHGSPIVDLEQRAQTLSSLIKQARTLAITHRMRIFLCGANEKRILP